MGNDAYGFIVYGVILAEPDNLPEYMEYSYDLEDWWRKHNGYVPKFDLAAMRASGNLPTDSEVFAEFEERALWLDAHLIPVKFENYSSGDDPLWMATVPGTKVGTEWGYATPFDPRALVVDEAAVQRMLEFLTEHNIRINYPPSWQIGACWR